MQTTTKATQEEQALKTKLRWLLVALTAVTYWHVSLHGFINYDDGAFVFSNPHVYTGLNLGNLKWALTTLNGDATSYQPLVWVSHQLDCQLFGLQAGVHHVTNLWFHIANVVLLFTLLDTLTGLPWRSGVVAGLFALHPLHVETVGWISERKSLVCTLFWLLTAIAYIRYVRRGGVARYWLMLVLYGAALVSKPVAVSLPLTFLLMDFWPLRRMRWQAAGVCEPSGGDTTLAGEAKGLGALVVEKVPLFVLSALACLVTMLAQTDMGAVRSLDEVPMSVRLSNSVVAYVIYLRKVFWPVDLAPIYPLRHDWLWWEVAGCAIAMICISIWALREAKRRPYVFVGWCWYLITLVPTLGLVQVGSQGLADRYSYVPLIGIFLLLVWEFSERLSPPRFAGAVSWVGASGVIAASALCTFVTVPYWQDSRSLFEHAIRVTGRNYVAYRQLGMAYQNEGKLREAEELYRESLKIDGTNAPTHMFLGALLFGEGKYEQALEEYSTAIKLKPADAQVHGKLAELYLRSQDARFQDRTKALEEARLACELNHYRRRELVAQLAETCAENCQFQEGFSMAQKALVLSASPQEIQRAKELLMDITRMLGTNIHGMALQSRERP